MGIKLFSGKDNTLPTATGINCSLKRSTRTLGVTLSFKYVSHTHTHTLQIPDGTNMVPD